MIETDLDPRQCLVQRRAQIARERTERDRPDHDPDQHTENEKHQRRAENGRGQPGAVEVMGFERESRQRIYTFFTVLTLGLGLTGAAHPASCAGSRISLSPNACNW